MKTLKKPWQLLGLMLAAIVAVLVGNSAMARITGTPPSSSDIWCVGPSGAESCVDASGSLVPTTDNAQDMGTSSLRFRNSYIAGNETLAGDETVAGNIYKTMVTTQTVTLSGIISAANACGGIVRLTAGGVNVTVAGFTAPSAANAGCILYVVNVGSGGGGTIGIATSATFFAQASGALVGANPGILLGTNDAIIVGQMGAAWVALGSMVINN